MNTYIKTKTFEDYLSKPYDIYTFTEGIKKVDKYFSSFQNYHKIPEFFQSYVCFTREDMTDYFGLCHDMISELLSVLLKTDCIIKKEDKNGTAE